MEGHTHTQHKLVDSRKKVMKGKCVKEDDDKRIDFIPGSNQIKHHVSLLLCCLYNPYTAFCSDTLGIREKYYISRLSIHPVSHKVMTGT